LIAAAGALGTVSRYGFKPVYAQYLGKNFPWGTLVINVTGCFIIGLLATLFADSNMLSKELQLAATGRVSGGILPHFPLLALIPTVFSATAPGKMGLINIAANIIIGMLAVVGGVGVAKLIK